MIRLAAQIPLWPSRPLRCWSSIPHQKAIITSGFSETEQVKEAQQLGAGQYIKNPYTLEKIGSAVKKEIVSTSRRLEE